MLVLVLGPGSGPGPGATALLAKAVGSIFVILLLENIEKELELFFFFLGGVVLLGLSETFIINLIIVLTELHIHKWKFTHRQLLSLLFTAKSSSASIDQFRFLFIKRQQKP